MLEKRTFARVRAGTSSVPGISDLLGAGHKRSCPSGEFLLSADPGGVEPSYATAPESAAENSVAFLYTRLRRCRAGGCAKTLKDSGVAGRSPPELPARPTPLSGMPEPTDHCRNFLHQTACVATMNTGITHLKRIMINEADSPGPARQFSFAVGNVYTLSLLPFSTPVSS